MEVLYILNCIMAGCTCWNCLFLSHLAKSKLKCSVNCVSFIPTYFIAKKKLTLSPSADFSKIIEAVKKNFRQNEIDERMVYGLIHLDGWVQIRKSNTEPIMRIYAEGRTAEEAENLADEVIEIVKKI